MRVTFRVVAGPHTGAVYVFEEHASFVVGRHRKTQFRLSLKDQYLSRFHFFVEVVPPLCALVDLGSTNKTYVNGEAVRRAELADGDTIKAGVTTLTVKIEGADANEEPPPPLDAASLPLFANYQIERVLGSGATGTVYLAADKRDGSRVALKAIDPSTAGALKSPERFEREAAALKSLDHPNIIALYEVGRAERWHYLAMEYVPGIDAMRLCQERGQRGVPTREAVGLVAQVLDGLSHAHAAGIVHRDVKPGNVLIARTLGGRPTAKLGDFGLARLYQNPSVSRLTKTNTLLGSIGFVAPEQIIDPREATPAADVYGAGATLYYLLTNQSPYDLPEYVDDCLSKILHEAPRPIRSLRPETPAALAEIVDRALAYQPEDRFLDAREMREELAPWAERVSERARPL
ncbi:MAG: protein kinase [Isosphaeraceae bacterium]